MISEFLKYDSVFFRVVSIRPWPRRVRCTAMAIFLWAICIFPASAPGQPERPIHIGFSSAIFSDINRNDILATTRTWGETFFSANDISALPETKVFDGIAEIRSALVGGDLDFVSLTTNGYARLLEVLGGDVVMISWVSGSITTEYLLLVRRDNGVDAPEGLRDSDLRLLGSYRASLAKAWLDVLLLRKGLGRTDRFFAAIEINTKISKVVLPVFFGQADACVVTRHGFDTMAELNPQIGEKLKAIAVSPPLIPSLSAFGLKADPEIREKASREMAKWYLTPAGQQCMTIFQSDRIEARPVSIMAPSLALVAEHRRLLDEAGEGAVPRGADPAHRKERGGAQ